MQVYMILACAALTATAECTTPDAAAGEGATNAPFPSAEVQATTNLVVAGVMPLPSTNEFQTSGTESVLVSNVLEVTCAKISYPDVPSDEFSVDEWAEELAEKAAQGLHIKNGQILIVVRLAVAEGEHQMLAKTRAKFRAIEFLRCHYPELPKEFSAPCRVIVCEMSDSGKECICVISFAMETVAQPQ